MHINLETWNALSMDEKRQYAETVRHTAIVKTASNDVEYRTVNNPQEQVMS